jgi:hypothetical protein
MSNDQYALSGELSAASKVLGAEIRNYTETISAPAIVAGVLTLDLTFSEFDVSLNANITSIVLTNVPSASKVCVFTIRFTADGTQRSIVWPASWRWADGIAPTMSSVNGKADIVTGRAYNGANFYMAIYSQNA